MTTGRINQIALFFLSLFGSSLPSILPTKPPREPTHGAATPIVASSPTLETTRAESKTTTGGAASRRLDTKVGRSAGRFLSLSLSLFPSIHPSTGSSRGGGPTPPPPSSSYPSPSLKYPHGLPSAGMSMPTRGTLTGRRRWAAAVTGPPIAPIGTVLRILRLARSQPPRAGACAPMLLDPLVRAHSASVGGRQATQTSPRLSPSGATRLRPGRERVPPPTCFTLKHTEPVPRRGRERDGPVHPLGAAAGYPLAHTSD